MVLRSSTPLCFARAATGQDAPRFGARATRTVRVESKNLHWQGPIADQRSRPTNQSYYWYDASTTSRRNLAAARRATRRFSILLGIAHQHIKASFVELVATPVQLHRLPRCQVLSTNHAVPLVIRFRQRQTRSSVQRGRDAEKRCLQFIARKNVVIRATQLLCNSLQHIQVDTSETHCKRLQPVLLVASSDVRSKLFTLKRVARMSIAEKHNSWLIRVEIHS
ncbi:hypothetical protein GQ600_10975 [Phytophthora cactorum]|nr:hypothetical protein GQ600_10975 [Phytophthora cactorum]